MSEPDPDPQILRLQKLYHGDVAPEIAALPDYKIRWMLKEIFRRAVFYIEVVSGASKSEGKYNQLDKQDPLYHELSEQWQTKCHALYFMQNYTDLQKEAVVYTYNGLISGKLELHIDNSNYLSLYLPEQGKICINLFDHKRPAADLLIHEMGHHASATKKHERGLPQSRRMDRSLERDEWGIATLEDELREILRQPSIKTPQDAWDWVTNSYRRDVYSTGFSDDPDVITILPKDEWQRRVNLPAAEKIELVHKLAQGIPPRTEFEIETSFAGKFAQKLRNAMQQL